MIYPKPDRKEKFIEHIKKGAQQGFLTKKECALCLKLGGIPEALLQTIQARINKSLIIWELIQRQLDLE